MNPRNILILPNYTQAFFLQVLVEHPDENIWDLKSFQDIIPGLGMPQGTITGIASGRAAHFQKEGAVLGRFYRIEGAEGYLMISVPSGKDAEGKHVYLTRIMRINLTRLGDGRKTPVIPPLNPADLGILGKGRAEYSLTTPQQEEVELAFNYLNGLSRLPPDHNCDAIGTMLGDVMLHQELQILSSVPSPARNKIKIEGEGENNSRTLLMVVCVGMLLMFIGVIIWHHYASKPVTEKATGNNTPPAASVSDSDYSDSPFDHSDDEDTKAQDVLPAASPDAAQKDASDQDADDAQELEKLSEANKKTLEKKAENQPDTVDQPAEIVKDQAEDPEQADPSNPMPDAEQAQIAAKKEKEASAAAGTEATQAQGKADLAQKTPQAENADRHADSQSAGVNGDAPAIEDDSNDDGSDSMMADPKNTQASASDSNEVILPAGPQADNTVASQAPVATSDSDNQSKTNPYSRDYETTGTGGSVLVDSGSVPTNPVDGQGTSENPAVAPKEEDGASVPGNAAQKAGTARLGAAEQKAAHGTLAVRDKAKAKDFAQGVVDGNDQFE